MKAVDLYDRIYNIMTDNLSLTITKIRKEIQTRERTSKKVNFMSKVEYVLREVY